MAEAAPALVKQKRARIVRPAMQHAVAHALHERKVNAPRTRSIFPNSANTAHEILLSFPNSNLKLQIMTALRLQSQRGCK